MLESQTDTAESSSDPKVDSLIFLGTGTSSQVPTIGCLTNPGSRCRVCPSSLHVETQKNRRRNTSALLSLSNGKNILIDCGKSFFEMAVQIWPRAKLRRIDALLLTHAHADAMLGLDDLRGWTLGRFIQDSIQVYCSQATFDAVKDMFPYMIDSDRATGGGDIPAFDWHIVQETGQFWVDSCGITVDTLKVEHGRYFDEARTPFICLGFKIDGVSYISDASSIPQSTKAKVEGSRVLVLDALKRTPHASHFSISQALEFIHSLEQPPTKTYLTDFTHDVEHYELEAHLAETEELDISPAYDGQQLDLREEEIKETDLLRDLPWIAVSEQVNGQMPAKDGENKVKSMV